MASPLHDPVAAVAAVLAQRAKKMGRTLSATPNAFGGVDFSDGSGRVVRLARTDPEGGFEIFVFGPNMILITDARIALGFPAESVAQVIEAGFSA